MVGCRVSAEIVTYRVFARNVVTKQPRTVNYERSGSLRVARDDKLRCKNCDRGLESGRTFGALRREVVRYAHFEVFVITKPHTSRCEASTSKRSALIPLSRQSSAYSRHTGNQQFSLVCSSLASVLSSKPIACP